MFKSAPNTKIVLLLVLIAALFMGYRYMANPLKPVNMPDEVLAEPLPINTKPKILAIGSGFSVGVKKDGTVWTWGTDYEGILARPITKPEDGYTPGQVPGIDNAKEAVATGHVVLVLKNDGTVWSWGKSEYGALGYEVDPTWADAKSSYKYYYTSVPRQVTGLPKVKMISNNETEALALDESGNVWGWGRIQKSLANGNKEASLHSVTHIKSLKNIERIGVKGSEIGAAINQHGELITWGMQGELTGQEGAIPSYTDFNGVFNFSAERQDKIINPPNFVKIKGS